MSKRKFKTEVDQLLHLLVHSLYSHSEIFLRELISNASDALDRLKYLTLSDEKLKNLAFNPRIDVFVDEKIITVADNGVGMDNEDLASSLGTIARSGTKRFLSQMTGDASKDIDLIGQFGVGFYSAFMVAERVEVISRKAGQEKAWRWESDGCTGFSIDESEREGHGTTVILHLNEEGNEYQGHWKLQQIIKKYSDHIASPIFLHYSVEEGKEKQKQEKVEQVNASSALWKRSKSQIKEEDYKAFYKAISHDHEDPLLWSHTQAEGKTEYASLLFVPSKAPFDLYQADYQSGVRLYIRRVFITDDDKELLPTYLRFARGIIDSDDLPLNVSREILQKNRILTTIRTAVTKRFLGEFKELASSDPEKYETFIEHYNRPLKEGLYSDHANRDLLLELVRYKSSKVDGWTSLAEYLERKRSCPQQKEIYYLTGDSEDRLRRSPLLEIYKKKGIEVLIMDSEIDQIVIPAVASYKDNPFKEVGRSDEESVLKEEDEVRDKELAPLLEEMTKFYGDAVKKVVVSRRLEGWPACVVLDSGDPSLQMRRMLQALGRTSNEPIKPIMEINPDHPIIKNMEKLEDKPLLKDISWLLLEQAMMVEGLPIDDPSSLSERLNRTLLKALGGDSDDDEGETSSS